MSPVYIEATRNWRGGRAYKRPPKVGTRIHHDIFGAGTVDYHRKDNGEVGIAFDVHGLKAMLWSFASRNGRVKTLIPRKP